MGLPLIKTHQGIFEELQNTEMSGRTKNSRKCSKEKVALWIGQRRVYKGKTHLNSGVDSPLTYDFSTALSIQHCFVLFLTALFKGV